VIAKSWELPPSLKLRRASRQASRRFAPSDTKSERSQEREVENAELLAAEKIMGSWIRDLRWSFRMLRKNAGITTIIVLTLALGIGANATVFCWIQHILWLPIPGAVDQGRIVGLVSNEGGGNTSLPDLRDLGTLKRVFAGAAASQVSQALLKADGQTGWVYGQVATANLFELLGVKPLLGRTFLPDEDLKPGGNPIVIISETLWRTRFGGDVKVVGQVVQINRSVYTIIGVTPSTFLGTMTGVACDFWTPISMYNQIAGRADTIFSRYSRPFHNFARLQPGVSLEQAQAAVSLLDSQLAIAYPPSNRYVHHRVVRYSEVPHGAQQILGPALRILWAVSFGVLLIVSANVTNLLLAQTASRWKETAICLATGATRGRLICQSLIESVLLALMGAIGGVLIASWGISLLGNFLPATNLPVTIFNYKMDATTLGVTILVTLLTSFLFGLVPALKSSQLNVTATLKDSGRSSTGNNSHHHWRHALVVAEIALSLVLLACAGLCYKGLQKAQAINIGLNPDRVVFAGLPLGMSGYNEVTGKVFYRQLLSRLSSLPEVEAATYASWLPLGLGGCKGNGVVVEGHIRRSEEDSAYKYAIIAPHYFSALRIPIAMGRDFTELDNADSLKVAIVNEAFASFFWPGQDPIGRKFRVAGTDRAIIGVVPTAKYNRLNERPLSFFYLPYQQYVPDLDLNVVIRTKGDPTAFIRKLDQAIHELNPNVSIWGSLTLSNHIEASLLVQRMASNLLGLMGAIALLLAAIGVYAMMAYSVRQRIYEFGIRMAIGAQSHDILWTVLRRGLMLTAVGLVSGLGLAFSVTPLLSSLLYGVSPYDPLIFAGIPFLLVAVSLSACFLPAYRATKADPTTLWSQ
jgi:predicted permease